MIIHVKLFGSLIDVSEGKAEFFLENLKDITAVKNKLLEMYPELSNYTFRIALNEQMAENNKNLRDNDVIAFLPPFAGG